MIRFFGKMAAVALASSLVLSAGTAQADAASPRPSSKLERKVYGEPEKLLAPMNSAISIFDGAVGREDGHDVMYTTTKGTTAVFSVVDLDDYKLLRSMPIPGVTDSWQHEVAPDGTVYIAAGGGSQPKLWSYSPETKELKGVADIPDASSTWALVTDEAGNAYVGTYPSGKVYRYDPVTKQVRDYGRLIGETSQEYVRSMAYYKGHIYAGTHDKKIFKLNVETGAKEDIADDPILDGEESFVYDLDEAGGYLFARFSKSSNMYVYDLEGERWLDTVIPNVTGLHVPKALEGKTYFISGGKLKSFDLAAHVVEDTGMAYASGLRGADWVYVDDPKLPGPNLVTIQFGGSVTFFNLETKTVRVFPPVVAPSASIVQAVETGPEGNLYVSGYTSAIGAIYNPATGQNTTITLGQADTMTPFEGDMWMGVYPNGYMYRYDPDKAPGAQNPEQMFQIGSDQDRINALTAAEGKLYIGTIPYYGKLGGAITVYDPHASGGPSVEVYRNVVENQSITGLAYRDGKIYGTTTIFGGLGSDPAASEAKMFVWDTESRTTVAEFTPRVEGAERPRLIGGISLGQDGLLWSTANGVIFAVNPQTLEVVKSRNLYPEVTDYGMWRPAKLYWSQDGLLYANVASKLTAIDPETLDFRYLGESESFALGADGNLYFTPTNEKTMLYKIAVSDRNIPGDVDGDGIVTGKDVSLVARHQHETVTEENRIYDVNQDGKIDSADVRLTVQLMRESRKEAKP